MVKFRRQVTDVRSKFEGCICVSMGLTHLLSTCHKPVPIMA